MTESPNKRGGSSSSPPGDQLQLPTPVRLPPWRPPPRDMLVDTRAYTNPDGYYNGRSVDQHNLVHFVHPGRQSASPKSLKHKQRGPGYGMNKGIHSPLKGQLTCKVSSASNHSPPRSPHEEGRFGHTTPPKIDSRPVLWSRAEAKAARKEHTAAEVERNAIEALYRQQDSVALAEQTERLQLAAEEAPRWTIFTVIFFPLGLGTLAAAAGFNGGATVLAVTVPLVAILAAVSTPFVVDRADLAKPDQAPCCGCLESRQETVATLVQAAVGLVGLIQLALLLLSFEVWLVGLGAAPASWWVPPEWMTATNVVDILFLVLCCAFSLADTFIWLVKDSPRMCCLPTIDRMGTLHRRTNFVLMRTVEVIIMRRVQIAAAWFAPKPGATRSQRLTRRWRQPSKLMLVDDVYSDPKTGVETRSRKTVFILPSDVSDGYDAEKAQLTEKADADREGASCFSRWRRSFQRREAAAKAVLNNVGAQVRLSPLKTAVACINTIVAAQGLVLTAPAFVALIAAIVTAASTTEYVRIVTGEVAYAEGLRVEQERRQQAASLRRAEDKLRGIVLQSLIRIDERKLQRAIDDALTAGVPNNVIKQASDTLRKVRDLKAGQAETEKFNAEREKLRREESTARLRAAKSHLPFEISLTELQAAIEDAIAAGVSPALVSESETAFTLAAHVQSLRERATARLTAYLEIAGGKELKDKPSPAAAAPVAEEVEEDDPWAMVAESMPEPIPPALAPEKDPDEDDEEALPAEPSAAAPAGAPAAAPAPPKALCSIDIQELDEALEEARRAGVDAPLLKDAVEMRQRALVAQAGLNAAATLFYVKLRRKGKEARWRNAGGEDRLGKATLAGKHALHVLRHEQKATPLSESIPPLENALAEAKSANLVGAALNAGEKLLKELQDARDDRKKALRMLEASVKIAKDVSSHSNLLHAEAKLVEYMPKAQAAFVDTSTLDEAQACLRQLRLDIRTAAAAQDRIVRARVFCSEQLRIFRTGAKSQLKMIAIPELEAALSVGKSAMLPYGIAEQADVVLRDSIEAREEAERAATFLATATKVGVKAMGRAAEDVDEAENTLKHAVDSLNSALQGVKRTGGAEEADITNAEELLNSMRQSRQRAALRRQNTAPARMLALA